MKRTLLTAALLSAFALASAQDRLWLKADKASLEKSPKAERVAVPRAYNLFSLDINQLKQQLADAPLRGTVKKSNLIISFPNAQGKTEHYRVFEAPVMHLQLSAAHPEIKSYVGQGVENPEAVIRFSTTIFGFHGMILSPKGTVYIDPYTKDLKNYISYRKTDLFENRPLECGFENTEDNGAHKFGPQQKSAASNDGILRTYRLAMASTIEYSAFHASAAGVGNGTPAQKKAAVLAAMNVSMTRINGVYERELAVTMQLVPNNEDIIFVTTDDFSNNSAGNLIEESQDVIDNIIGNGDYDIGHTVSTGAGGLALLGVVCSTPYKAMGVTGSDAPVGDPYDIDYVAHEMGHQFGANHTFNGTGGSCSGNANNQTAVEPGSGTTIMGYAGICGSADVQQHSDAYFNTVSLDEMFAVISNTSCAEITDLNNSAPEIAALSSYTIPNGTAFVLKSGTVTDADGDALTYCWEQVNGTNSRAVTPSSTATTGPNYRSLSPTTSPDRYFPEFNSVMNGDLYPTWEVTSDIGRTMNFALTVRDNNASGGQTARRNMSVAVVDGAGPFLVTSQDLGEMWLPNTQQTITWAVAGTTANGVNTSAVNILLSTNNGQSFDTVLAANTPNDGSETITVPNTLAPFCRIKVEAVNNIYYALNASTFSLGYLIESDCTTYDSTGSVSIPDGTGEFATSTINVSEGTSVAEVNVGVNITHTYVSDLTIKAVSPNGTEVILWNNLCGDNNNINATFSDSGSTLSCGNPTQGTVKPVGSLSDFFGENPTGGWSLAVSDNQDQDSGTLNSWNVQVCSYTFIPAGTEGFGLQGFKLYPNPNAGIFTVEFQSASQNNINVKVHDIRGREVYTNDFTNTGLVSGNVNLQNVQQGVYLVTVQDGNRKETRKIVVN